MCGSLLSKFKKNSNKVAPVLGAGYLVTKRVSTKTNLAVETAWVDENMSLDDITVGRKARTTVQFPDITRFIEVKPFRDTKESKEENTPSTSDESSRLEPVFGSDAECKSKTEAQSMENAIITATVQRIDDNVPPVIEGQKMTTMDLKIHNEKMVASQSDAHFSSKARLSNEITITTVNKESLASVQSGRFSGCTVQQSSENVLEATNQQTLAPIDDNEKTLTAPHDDPQETAVDLKAPTANREENATAKEDKLSTCGENCKIDIVSVSDAECQSKAEAMSKEIAVTTLTSASPSLSTEKHHEEKITVVVNDPRSSSKVSLSDEVTQGSHVAVQRGQCSDFRVLQTTETVLEAVDRQALAPIDKGEEKLTAAHGDSQEIVVVSKPLLAAIKENMTARENTVSTSNENNKLEDVSGSDAKCESKAEMQSMEGGLTKVERRDGLDQSHSRIKVAWDTENHEEKMAAIYIDTHSNQASKKSLAAAQSPPFSDCTVQQPAESKIAVEDQRAITFIDKHEEKLSVINGDLQESHIISKPLSADGHGLTEINFKQTKDKMNALSGSPSFILSAKRSAETILSVPQKLATIDASEEKLTVVEVGSGSIHVEETPVTPKPSLARQEKISRTHDDSASQSTAHSPDNPYQLINREVLFAKATKELEEKIFRMTLRSSAKDRKLLLAVAKKELKKKIIQMTSAQGGVTSIATTRSPTYPERKSIRPKNKETSLAIAKKQFAESIKEKIAALQSGQSSSNAVRSIPLGKTKNTIAFEVLDANKRKQTVIPSARLPLHLRKLDDPPPLPLTAEVFNAKLFRAQENRLRELEQVRSRARYMAWSPKKTYRQ